MPWPPHHSDRPSSISTSSSMLLPKAPRLEQRAKLEGECRRSPPKLVSGESHADVSAHSLPPMPERVASGNGNMMSSSEERHGLVNLPSMLSFEFDSRREGANHRRHVERPYLSPFLPYTAFPRAAYLDSDIPEGIERLHSVQQQGRLRLPSPIRPAPVYESPSMNHDSGAHLSSRFSPTPARCAIPERRYYPLASLLPPPPPPPPPSNVPLSSSRYAISRLGPPPPLPRTEQSLAGRRYSSSFVDARNGAPPTRQYRASTASQMTSDLHRSDFAFTDQEQPTTSSTRRPATSPQPGLSTASSLKRNYPGAFSSSSPAAHTSDSAPYEAEERMRSRERNLLSPEEAGTSNTAERSPTSPRKLAKSHVPSACINCKRAHLACDVNRPCRRCVNLGRVDTCIDIQHKKRGRPRIRDRDATTLGNTRNDQRDFQPPPWNPSYHP